MPLADRGRSLRSGTPPERYSPHRASESGPIRDPRKGSSAARSQATLATAAAGANGRQEQAGLMLRPKDARPENLVSVRLSWLPDWWAVSGAYRPVAGLRPIRFASPASIPV